MTWLVFWLFFMVFSSSSVSLHDFAIVLKLIDFFFQPAKSVLANCFRLPGVFFLGEE